jgi:hypothetical protein
MKSLVVRVCSLVAWLACLDPVLSQQKTTEAESPFRVYCLDSPALNTWKNATPKSFEVAIRAQKIHHELDEHGEGIRWGLAHWVEVHNPPHRRDQVDIPGKFEFRATSHLLIFREFWTYKNDGKKGRKKEWVRRTVAHLTAGGPDKDDPGIRYGFEDDSEFKKGTGAKPFDAKALANRGEAYPIAWKGKTFAWIKSGWAAKDNRFEADYECFRDEKGEVAIPGKKRIATRLALGSIYLNWSFVVRRSPDGITPDLGSPGPRPEFIIPPKDEG